MVAGDFNVDVSDLSTNLTMDLLSLFHGFGLHQRVSEPTRVMASLATTLDLVFCSDSFLSDPLSVISELGT